MKKAASWAAEEFSSAALGDRRRTERLVCLASEVASQPAGTVTGACRSSASREGAFRWLENHGIRREPVLAALQRATLKRSKDYKRVYVPVDTTSLTLTDEKRCKGFGAVGSWTQGSRGIHVMTGFALGEDGAPLGVCAQQMWVREQKSKTRAKATSSATEQRETQHWLDVLRSTHEAFKQQAPGCEPFYQLDRGADCWPVLALASQLRLLLTVRAAHDRRVDTAAGSLLQQVAGTAVRAKFRLNIAARGPIRKRRRCRGKRIHWRVHREARVATFAVRATQVPLILADCGRVEFNAVLVRELRKMSDDRIEWLLLTTHPIKTKAQVRAVVHGYTQRWRIEELHRTWKRGLCRVEDTQLRSRQAVFKWATILAAVAARAMRLTYLAREKPDLPATSELTPRELDALIVMREPKGIQIGHVPTLSQAVRWLADLGGYTGPWNGPPGPTVVGRGLHDLLIATRALRNFQKMR